MVLAYNTNAGGGLLSGAEKLSSAYLERNRRKGLASGLEQIQGGDWEGGVNTIAQTDPDTALGLAQYKQEADDKIALQQAKMQQEAELRNTLTPYQQEMLALKRQQLAQGGESNPFNSKNEFINLMGIRNNQQVWDSLPDDQKALVNARLNYMSNAPENIYDTSYQKKAGSLQAEREGKQEEAFDVASNQTENIKSLIGDIKANRGLLGVYSPVRVAAARYTNGSIGYSPEELEKRGNIIRRLGEIQNSIIQKARAAGQVGINTLAEIEQATKGLNEASSDQEIIGALEAINNSEQRLIERINQQRRHKTSTTEVIDASEYFK